MEKIIKKERDITPNENEYYKITIYSNTKNKIYFAMMVYSILILKFINTRHFIYNPKFDNVILTLLNLS